jgi:hypothetical protein
VSPLPSASWRSKMVPVSSSLTACEVKNHNPAADHHRCGLERLWKLRAEFIHFFLETFPA